MRARLRRAERSLRRAAVRERRTRTPRGRWFTAVACAVAGFMIVTSALAARGTDLRPNRNIDLIDLVSSESERNKELAAELSRLRGEVDTLSKREDSGTQLRDRLNRTAEVAGLTAVQGPAVSVTLTDAPLSVKPQGVDEDLLVVHQQDIQAIANALWAGGAEAMTIQGQRVTARTGIKCVGNTVVLHGVPYAPPYVITAIGDPGPLEAALQSSPYVTIYKQYVDAYGLGYSQQRLPNIQMPPYRGSLDLRYAKRA